MDSVQPGLWGGGICWSREGALSVAQNLKRHFWEDSAAFEHMLCRGAWAVSGRAEPRTKDGNLSPIQAAFPSCGRGSLSPKRHLTTSCIHLLSPFIIPALIHFYFTLLGIHRYYLTEHLLCAKHQACSRAAERGAWVHGKHGGKKDPQSRGREHSRESVWRGCVCGSGQDPASSSLSSWQRTQHSLLFQGEGICGCLAPLTQADPHFRDRSLFESSLTESSLSILQGERFLFPHLAS